MSDTAFPYFTSEQADRFRTLVADAFARLGKQATVYPDHVVDENSRVYGLANIAARCHNDERGEAAWPELIGAHVETIVRVLDADSPFETLTQQQAYENTYARLVSRNDLAPLGITYARAVAGDLVEILNLDQPDSVVTYDDERVAALGPYEDLRRAGYANLRRVETEHEVVDFEDGRIDVITGDSMFIASLALIVDEIAARYTSPPTADGIFWAAPFRHQLAFHVIRDSSAIASLQLLARFADLGYGDGVGTVSPEVFWSRPGSIVCLSTHTDDGIEIHVDQELHAILERLSG